MLMLPCSVRIYVASQPIDLRAGHDHLVQLVRRVVQADPMSGHLFVFLNRRRNRVKILWWDRSGWAMLYKRLEIGTFRLPFEPLLGQRHIEMDPAELALMLEGIDLSQSKRQPRWRRLPHERSDVDHPMN
jgi:transposase